MPELQRQSGHADINIEDGVDYSLTAIYKIDGAVQPITGWTASFRLLDLKGNTSDLLELTESTGIIITGSLGKVVVNITDAQSIFGSRTMRYDLMITSPVGSDVHLLRGACKSWSAGE